MKTATRRNVLVGVGVALLPLAPARARSMRFAIDWQGGPETPEIATALADQIALIEALPIDPAIATFFAGQRIAVDRTPGSMSRIGPDGVHFERRAVRRGNPVLLHELLHRYHLLRLADGYENARVRTFYREARESGHYPPDAYMLTNPIEFFAMTATAILAGKQPRPPFSRAEVATKSPGLHRWIVTEFALRR